MSFRSILPVIPGAVVLGATAAALAFAAPAAALPVPHLLVYATLLVTALLAWRFHTTRLFTAALLLAAAFAVLQSALFSGHRLTQVLLATFLPLGISLLTLSSDRGFVLSRLRNHMALALAPLVLGAFFSSGDGDRASARLHATFIDPAYTDWSSLPQLALLALLIALTLAFTRTVLKRRAPEAGLTWSALAAACAFAAPSASQVQSIWLLAGALVLIMAVIEAAHALAFYDELTELPGRRALAQTLQSLGEPYAIAIVDVDHFKSFNDQHGHDVGDQVLRMVAARLRRVAGGGTAFRSGGEEFTIVFPGSSKREAREHVEVVRAAIADARFAVRKLPRPRGKRAPEKRGRAPRDTRQLSVTISVGVAGPSGRHNTTDAVLKLADKAMYRAKREGRNRVVA